MTRRGLHRITILTACATLVLLCAGALVTSTGSGLAVPDWPLSYGKLFPPMVGGVLYEHGHRLVAGTVGILTLIQTVLFTRFEDRKAIRQLSWAALAMVVVQALLGGLTVRLRLPVAVSVTHACVGQLFFCMVVLLSASTSPMWDRIPSWTSSEKWVNSRLPTVALFLCFAFFFQLLMGAVMRHTGAGLAIPDFPMVFGGIVPPEFTPAVTIHYAHRLGALGVVIFASCLAYQLQKNYSDHIELTIAVGVLLVLLSTQVLLAAMIIWLKKPVFITMGHVAVGATCFGTSVWLAARAYRVRYLSVGKVGDRVCRSSSLLPAMEPA